MKDTPLLMTGAMVRATLRDVDPKGQTRRVMNPQPKHKPILANAYTFGADRSIDGAEWLDADFINPGVPMKCPYGQVGDRLYVRETFYAFGRWETRFNPKKGRDEWHFVDMTKQCGKSYSFDADSTHPVPMGKRGGVTPGWHKRPGIFLPRAASRLTLEITDIRVERVKDISEEDAIAEGVAPCGHDSFHTDQHTCSFADLWDLINAKRDGGIYSWESNPWVWAITFKKL